MPRRVASDGVIGAGARVPGGVKIDAHAVVGANAVVLCDVPAGATVVSGPARAVARTEPFGPTLETRA
jgi:serine O-acetyltransferase